MKTQNIAKQVCSLVILALAPGAFAQAPTHAVAPAQIAGASVQSNEEVKSLSDDPIGEWIEKNADRFGLYVDKTPRTKSAKPNTQVPARPVPQKGVVTIPSQYQPIPVSTSPAASAPSASASGPQGSDPIQAFIINRVFDVPAEAVQSPPFSKTPMTGASDANPGRTTIVNLQAFEPAPIVEVPVPEVPAKAFVPPQAASQAASGAAQIAAVMKDLDFADKCSGFATPSGFGPWGKAVIKEFVDGNANSLLQGTDDLRRACPAYDYLTTVQKSHVWVTVFASMAFLESSCDPRKVGQGPNGKAVGLLQLHAGNEQKAAPGCNRQDSRSPITSLTCAMSIVETQVKDQLQLFSRITHFGVLRPQGDLVKTRAGVQKRVVKARVVAGGVRELPFCQRSK